MGKINNNEFVKDNYKLIISACKIYYTRCSGYIDFDDYLNHCCLILLYRKPFDPKKGKKPSTFIYKCVEMETYNILKKYQTHKRNISQENLLSIDYIKNDENSKYKFKENNILESYDDYTEEYVKELLPKIKARMTPEQLIQLNFMLQGLTPKDVEKLTGENHKDVQQKRVMIRRKAKQEIEKFNR